METVLAVVHVAAFVAGLLVLFYTLFSYEDEEQKLKSWFEAAWIALKTGDEGIGARLRAFLRKLLNGLNRMLTRLYGERVMSVRAIAAGICYAFALSVLGAEFGNRPIIGQPLVTAIVFVVLVAAPLGRRNWPVYATALAPLMWLLYVAIVRWSPNLVFGIGALIIDGFLVVLIRRYFLKASTAPTFRAVVRYAIGATSVAPLYVLAIASLGLVFIEEMDPPVSSMAAVSAFVMINAVPVLTSLSLLFVLGIAVLLRIVYAVLPRAIYVPIKLKLLDNRKAATGLGIALMGISIPGAVGFMEKAAKAMGLA